MSSGALEMLVCVKGKLGRARDASTEKKKLYKLLKMHDIKPIHNWEINSKTLRYSL